MSTIKSLIGELRPQINDSDTVTYQDTELLNYFNQGIRALRRIVSSYKPMLLVVPVNGTTTADQETIVLPANVIRIMDFRIQNSKVDAITVTSVNDLTTKGKPTAYYQQGMMTLRLVPIPDASYSYSGLYIPEGLRLTVDGDTGFPTDFDDVLIEYVGIRTGLRNRAEPQSEKELLSLWHDQVKQLLTGMETNVTLVQGYFDSPTVPVRVSSY